VAFDLLDKVIGLLRDGLGLHTKDAVDPNPNPGVGRLRTSGVRPDEYCTTN